MKKRLIIVDVSNFIFRAFFAIKVLHSPSGTPVNAVHGFLSMLLKLLSQYRPTHLLLAKDTKGETFRNEIFKDYKANRSAPPDDLVPQFDLIQELIEKMKLPYIADPKFEADDIIGSACVQWRKDFDEIFIASGDKDLMQFVDSKIKVIDTMKDKIYGAKEVFEKMGVHPSQIVDYLSMVGDASDNVPGMKGIGSKGAAKLLSEYENFEKCIEASSGFKGKKLINAFENHLEEGLLSKKLVEIVTDVHLSLPSEKTQYLFYPSDELLEFLKSLGLKASIKRLEEMRREYFLAEQSDKSDSQFLEESFDVKFPYEISLIKNKQELFEKIKDCKTLALHTEYDSKSTLEKKLVSISIAIEEDKAFIIGEELANEVISSIFNKDYEIFSEHSKRDFIYALTNNIPVQSFLFDIVQAHYNISPEKGHDFSLIISDILGNGPLFDFDKKQGNLIQNYSEDFAQKLMAERAILLLKSGRVLKKNIEELGLQEIFYQIDSPLMPILAKMEKEGILINPPYFEELSKDLEHQIQVIEDEVKNLTENPVNLNSPKQIGKLLFEDLKLPILRKTKTGNSTDSEVLEELSVITDSPIPDLILKFREYSKILSTYAKAIPLLKDPHDGKIHTHFNQHGTQTGRLSSHSPNLQNIPVRSSLGRLIRKGFIATPGHVFLAADYSQVELRLLAHFSEDSTMVDSFLKNKDIHAQTASEVLGIPLEEIDSNHRSIAKAVNFGLMYGQSSFGLSKQLKISRKEAKEYIELYFSRFAQVKIYLDKLKELCEEKGFAQTLHGRKRFLPEIHSQNRLIKSNAERMAINTPIQGTAADLIKLAMIKIDQEMEKMGAKSKMLLQVHDELIFDVPEEEIESMKKIIQTGMEEVVKLKVPLKVNISLGVNWYDLK